MATITDFIDAATAGFVAVAEQRNADVAALNTSITQVDDKADAAAASAITAQEAASAAQADADAACMVLQTNR
jgi:hypothetical protein